MNRRSCLVSLLGCSAWTSFAWAHPQANFSTSGSLASGLAHPCLGFDHLLAMVAVGLLAVQLGRRAIWALPTGFVSGMLFGGLVGIFGWQLPATELAIALSLVTLGTAVAVGRQYPLFGTSLAVALLGLFHGHAHGTEIPSLAAPAWYVVGFLAATLLLHLAGAGVGSLATRVKWVEVGVRWSGAAIGAVGVLLLL